MNTDSLKFIDLFAGLGGFHIGLTKLGHKCVFASEKKNVLAQLYFENYSVKVNTDIKSITPSDIPKHDLLCAGFPCQPFSKAGDRQGLNDSNNGNLFYYIRDILQYHRPKYFILENVANLENHDKGKTWMIIKDVLEKELNYTVDKAVLSPHQYGIPQHRQRLFIVGCSTDLSHFKWPIKFMSQKIDISEILDINPSDNLKIEDSKVKVLSIWQDFLNLFPAKFNFPSFPIWSMEFGATYPFESQTPYTTTTNELSNFSGSFGTSLQGLMRSEQIANIPTYARTPIEQFPTWKKNYIRQNRAFYLANKNRIDTVLPRLRELNVSSWQKFEWNIKNGVRQINNHIVQFRGSGVRIKKFDYFPSLVTVSTQIPIIASQNRYISPQEGAKIQSLNGIKLPPNKGACFSALGNAVNAELVRLVAKNLLK